MQELEYEIVVIDNASFDGSAEMAREEFPGVRFIQSEKNLGFARANNAAFGSSTGRNILFLNPDTEMEGSAPVTLSHALDSLPNAGVVGAKLLNSDRSIQTSCIRAFPTILNQVLESDALRKTFPHATLWGMQALFADNTTPTEVDAVSGACLMIKRSVFETVRMFSNDYFMYSEDIDLCFKVHEAGWKTYYVPTAVIIHHGGGSSSQSGVTTFASVVMLESRWRFFRKTRSIAYCLAYRVAMCSAGILRIASAFIGWPIYKLRGRGDVIGNIITKWTARLRWTLGGERWVKNS